MNIGDLFAIKGIQVDAVPGKGTPVEGRVDASSLRLVPGELVKGSVIEASQQGRFLLSIDGNLVMAESRVLLREGETLWLEVKQGGEKPLFVLAEKKAAVQEAMRALLADAPSLGKIFRALSLLPGPDRSFLSSEFSAQMRPLINAIAASSTADRPAPEAVMRLVASLTGAGSGRLAELLFRPLTPDVLASPPHASTGQDAEGELTSGNLERLAGFLKLLGHINQAPASPDQQPFLLFPCFFSGAAGWGEWLFSLERDMEEADKSRSYSLEFFLEMSRLGDVHLHLRFQNRSVQGDLAVSREAVLAHVEKQMPTLQHAIEGLGFGPVQVHCRISEKTHLLNLKETLEDKAGLHPSALFHVTA